MKSLFNKFFFSFENTAIHPKTLLAIVFNFITWISIAQTVSSTNHQAHLVQVLPFRLLPNDHQIKLVYEYQPAKSKYAFGIAPSFRMVNNDYDEKGSVAELQPFVSVIKHRAKSELYAQFFLKADYFSHYDPSFKTREYYHEPDYFFFIPIAGGTFADIGHQQQNFVSFGGGVALGYRKFFGRSFFMDLNAGLQYLAHSSFQFPEQQSEVAGPFIKSDFYAVGSPASPVTFQLGFGYRFTKNK